MYISKILNFNREDGEAELCITDGDYSVICYAYPTKTIAINQKVSGIYGFLCSEIVKSFENNYCINKLPQYYAYLLTAKVISKNGRIVQIGNLKIYLDTEFPKDILEGDYVSFRVQRLDIQCTGDGSVS